MLGDKLKELRKQRGLTQNQLAELSGIHPVSIRKYETNTITPMLPQLVKLAKGLNVDLSVLVNTPPTFTYKADIQIDRAITVLTKEDEKTKEKHEALKLAIDALKYIKKNKL